MSAREANAVYSEAVLVLPAAHRAELDTAAVRRLQKIIDRGPRLIDSRVWDAIDSIKRDAARKTAQAIRQARSYKP